MKYVVNGYIPFEVEIEALSPEEAKTQAMDLFDAAEYVSYNEVNPIFKSVALSDSEEVEEIIEEDEDSEYDD